MLASKVGMVTNIGGGRDGEGYPGESTQRGEHVADEFLRGFLHHLRRFSLHFFPQAIQIDMLGCATVGMALLFHDDRGKSLELP